MRELTCAKQPYKHFLWDKNGFNQYILSDKLCGSVWEHEEAGCTVSFIRTSIRHEYDSP